MAFEHGDTFMAQSALQRHMTKAQMAAQKHDHDHPVPLWLLRKTANRENKSGLLKHHTRHDVERIVAKELSAEIMEASESVVLSSSAIRPPVIAGIGAPQGDFGLELDGVEMIDEEGDDDSQRVDAELVGEQQPVDANDDKIGIDIQYSEVGYLSHT